jgi:hypothetical protein
VSASKRAGVEGALPRAACPRHPGRGSGAYAWSRRQQRIRHISAARLGRAGPPTARTDAIGPQESLQGSWGLTEASFTITTTPAAEFNGVLI